MSDVNPPNKKAHPDIQLIRKLDSAVFPEFGLNVDCLKNWQAELCDLARSPEDLDKTILLDVILVYPRSLTLFSLDNKVALTECITELNLLENDIYLDFKLIIHQLILRATTHFTTARVQLHKLGFLDFLLNDVLTYTDSIKGHFLQSDRLILMGKLRCLMEFLELGCDAKQLKKLISPLFSKVRRIGPDVKDFYLTLLRTVLRLCPAQFPFLLFNNFIRRPISIPFNDELNLQMCFSISTWFKINNLDETTQKLEEYTSLPFILLDSSSNYDSISLKIEIVQFRIVITLQNRATSSLVRFSFNHIISSKITKNQGYIHICLTYDQSQKLSLYVDGDYSELIPCPSLQKSVNRWNKICIGQLIDDTDVLPGVLLRDELLIKDLNVLDLTYSSEWIKFIYLLGIGFDWGLKEFSEPVIHSMLGQLFPKDFMKLALEVQSNSGDNAVKNLDSIGGIKSQGKHKTIDSKGGFVQDKNKVLGHLMKRRPHKSNFLFDSNDAEFIEFLGRSNSQEIIFFQPQSISSSLYCVGGSGLLLAITDVIIKDDYESKNQRDSLFLKVVDIILHCSENDLRIDREFEGNDGYHILGLLANYYKENYNPQLDFEILGESSEVLPIFGTLDYNDGRYERSSLINKFLSFSKGSTQANFITHNSIFKTLVLNFDLYRDTKDFQKLLEAIGSLLSDSNFKSLNLRELNKMRFFKRSIQHIKSIMLNDYLNPQTSEELELLLKILSHLDASVDTIRNMSQLVIFALYVEPSNSNAHKIGLKVLTSIRDKLCSPSLSMKLLKKFSRAITIHWILLLLHFKSEDEETSLKVVCNAVSLLVRFFQALGPHVITKFFQANKGLDVLTYFLQGWWNNDQVISLLFLASFGTDPNPMQGTLSSILAQKPEFLEKSELIVPDFILLINNLALTGICLLSQKLGRGVSTPSSPIKSPNPGSTSKDEVFELSFDTLHMVNLISDVIEVGASSSPPLKILFNRREWLEGVFEILAHLKIMNANTDEESPLKKNFEISVERLSSVLSTLFISRILKSSQIFDLIHNVNDITKKIILNLMFPRLFKHFNEFVGASNFIFKQSDLLKGVSDLICHYYNEFILQNYYVSNDDLEVFIACIFKLLETNDQDSIAFSRLGPILGNVLVLRLSNLSYPTRENCLLNEDEELIFMRDLDSNVVSCLYKQALILQPSVLDDNLLRQVIDLIMGNFLKLNSENQSQISEHVLNFIRTATMVRQNTFHKIIEQLVATSDYRDSFKTMNQFFAYLTTRNDEETIKYLQRFPSVKHIFHKNFHFRLSKLKDVGTINILDMFEILLINGGTLGFLNSSKLHFFEKGAQGLKSFAINAELLKYNRELQDKQENLQFFSTLFSSIKLEIFGLYSDNLPANGFILDYIEGTDRMRKLLVVEDQLPDSERLTYSVKVPIKSTIPLDIAMENSEYAAPYSGLENLKLNETLPSSVDAEEFEELDELGETSYSSYRVYEDRNRKVLHSLFLGDQIQYLFNISRISGLDAVESLMIIGFSHIYFIDNYFHCQDDNVVNIEDAPEELRDPYLQLIKPQSGTSHSGNAHRTKSWSLEKLSAFSKRRFLLRDIAVELFFADGASLLITCFSTSQRDHVCSKLSSYAKGHSLDKDLAIALNVTPSQSTQDSASPQSFFRSKIASAFSSSHISSSSILEITAKWKKGRISNFYYLMCLNTMAGRTFNDLTQYPVFPWVIADYESEKLNLHDPKTFRDLSKPMGAQSLKRAAQFLDRYEALEGLNDENAPPFHYGTHYSSAMIVASYMIRLKPYVQSYLLLQGGRFDHADRLFNSVEKAWLSASRDNTTDVRELTPEFFYLSEFLENKNDFEFGQLQSGERVNDVQLPKWAKGDPKIFIAKNREALESPYVSEHLHKWIDLIFGHKQSGPDAIAALNVFHHLSYDGAINIDKINDEVEKRAVIGMINNFGQTPLKLFSRPHVQREVFNLPDLYFSGSNLTPPNWTCTFESKLSLPIEKLEVSSKTGKWIGRPHCTASEDSLSIRKPVSFNLNIQCGSLIINGCLMMNLDPAGISNLLQIGNRCFLTGSDSGMIHAWKCTSQTSLDVSCSYGLRGHLAPIKLMCYSKSFKVCVSVDSDGVVILWDLTRFKLIRKVTNAGWSGHLKLHVSISNDTGKFCIIQSSKYSNMLAMYTINGEKVLQETIEPGSISSLSIAANNDSLVELLKSEYCHSYWSSELIALSYSSPLKKIQIYQMKAQEGWCLTLLQTVDMSSLEKGSITALLALKRCDLDEEEKISRSHLSLILGDSLGRVYVC